MKKNLSIMIKPASSLCNLRCEYCFYQSLSNKRGAFSYGVMEEDTAKNLIQQAIAVADGGNIYFVFQGGEPLISGLEFYQYFIKTVNLSNTNCKIFYSLQTNGILLDEAFAEFFAENKFLLGISLDGDIEGNKYRKDDCGNNSYDRVVAKIEILQKHKVEFNILVVATKNTAKRIEKVFNYFADRHFKYLQFIPCLKPLGDNSANPLVMNGKEYGKYLVDLFSLYLKQYTNGNYVSVRYFDNLINLYRHKPSEQCGMNGFCSRQFVIEGNGNVYPCDFYCIDKYLLGNINSESLDKISSSKIVTQFLQESIIISKKCQKCKYNFLCHACGCKRYRENIDDYCKAYYYFFENCLEKLETFKI